MRKVMVVALFGIILFSAHVVRVVSVKTFHGGVKTVRTAKKILI